MTSSPPRFVAKLQPPQPFNVALAADMIARNDGKIADLLSVFVDKAKQACFIDIVVGLALIAIVGRELYLQQPVAIWPLIAALAITRAGDTLKVMARDFAYFWHREPPNGQAT